jgi:hypothetical protein
MKQVKIKSLAGNMLSEINNSDCYIFVPSVAELGMLSEPYVSEGALISHFTEDSTRICYTLEGVAVQYWTRSPTMGYDNKYVYRIAANGTMSSITSLNSTDIYARIMISM